ncbi:INPP5K isoform 4 [Pan troglodytes]|uniref:Inositol polyphosphate-5-phosphatase K n=3 Tax=Hominidae TaxID=9604 RepID=J3KN07_HUMAN|nr:inositol polyphosphate-5-phosphatase K [Homo sapiens]KAI4046953.1 inositol polyphosphate-5-phosphatase K [Homo sapiens]PNI23317.1 INPP5K isoform 4 [Pan troglodytes]PNJ22428.1 INPP5K isoform 4 [Pongo abelii]
MSSRKLSGPKGRRLRSPMSVCRGSSYWSLPSISICPISRFCLLNPPPLACLGTGGTKVESTSA